MMHIFWALTDRLHYEVYYVMYRVTYKSRSLFICTPSTLPWTYSSNIQYYILTTTKTV